MAKSALLLAVLLFSLIPSASTASGTVGPKARSADAVGAARAERMRELLLRAQRDVFSAETTTHLLMSSSQATLTRMRWDFGRWGLTRHKSVAASDFERVSGKITNYRELASQVGTITEPLALFRAEIEKSERVQAAAKKIPKTIAGQVEEIHRLRAEYDADASRSALIRASSGLAALQKEFGPSRLKISQTRALALARGIQKDIQTTRLRTARSLPNKDSDASGAHRKGRSLIMKNLSMLADDVEDLGAEIARLEIHYQLNNYIKDGLRK